MQGCAKWSLELGMWIKKQHKSYSKFNVTRKKTNICHLVLKIVSSKCFRRCPCGVMVKALDCRIVVCEFVLQSRYYVHFQANTLGKGMSPLILPCPVSWGCRIHWLHLCRGVRPPPNECPGYDTKQSDGEVPATLELWGMRSTPSLPSLPGPLWPGVVAPDKGPIYGLNRTKPCFFHYTDFCI